MLALDIAAMQPFSEFKARVNRFVAELKAVPRAQGFNEIVYPGKLKARNDAQPRAPGLRLPDDTLGDLEKLAVEYGVRPAFTD